MLIRVFTLGIVRKLLRIGFRPSAASSIDFGVGTLISHFVFRVKLSRQPQFLS